MTQLRKAVMDIHFHSQDSIGSYPRGSRELSGQRVGWMLHQDNPHRLSSHIVVERICARSPWLGCICLLSTVGRKRLKCLWL